MKVVTRFTSNASGRNQVIAKGGGKQRTVSWEHAESVDWNHGAAAGTLLAAIGGYTANDPMTHVVNNDGSHTFEVTPA